MCTIFGTFGARATAEDSSVLVTSNNRPNNCVFISIVSVALLRPS